MRPPHPSTGLAHPRPTRAQALIESLTAQLDGLELKRAADELRLKNVAGLLQEERATRAVATSQAEGMQDQALEEATTLRETLERCEDELIAAHAESLRLTPIHHCSCRAALPGAPDVPTDLSRFDQLQQAHAWSNGLFFSRQQRERQR